MRWREGGVGLWMWGWKQPLKISWNIPKNMELSEGEGGRWWIVDVGVEVALSSQSASVAPTSQTLLAAGRLWPTKTNSCQQLLKKSHCAPLITNYTYFDLKMALFSKTLKSRFCSLRWKFDILLGHFAKKIEMSLTKKIGYSTFGKIWLLIILVQLNGDKNRNWAVSQSL